MRHAILFVLLFWVGCMPKIDFTQKAQPPLTDAHIYDQTSPSAKDLAPRIELALRQELKKNKYFDFINTDKVAAETYKRGILSTIRDNSAKELESNTFGELSLWRDVFLLDLLIFGVLKGSEYSQILELYTVDLKAKKISSRVQIYFLLEAQNTDEDLAALAKKEIQRIVSVHQKK